MVSEACNLDQRCKAWTCTALDALSSTEAQPGRLGLSPLQPILKGVLSIMLMPNLKIFGWKCTFNTTAPYRYMPTGRCTLLVCHCWTFSVVWGAARANGFSVLRGLDKRGCIVFRISYGCGCSFEACQSDHRLVEQTIVQGVLSITPTPPTALICL